MCAKKGYQIADCTQKKVNRSTIQKWEPRFRAQGRGRERNRAERIIKQKKNIVY